MTAVFTCKPRDSNAVDADALKRDSESIIAWFECLWAGVGYLTTLAVEHISGVPTEAASIVAMEHLENLLRTALNLVVNSPVPSLRDSVKRIFVNVVTNQLVRKDCLIFISRIEWT